VLQQIVKQSCGHVGVGKDLRQRHPPAAQLLARFRILRGAPLERCLRASAAGRHGPFVLLDLQPNLAADRPCEVRAPRHLLGVRQRQQPERIARHQRGLQTQILQGGDRLVQT
jgi:hypothetical protein